MFRISTPSTRRAGCDARVNWVHPFGWCNRLAAYERGKQKLCEFHAGMVAAGELPLGITEDGKWKNPTVVTLKASAL